MPSQYLRQRKYKLIFQEIFPLYVQFIIPLRESLLPPLPSCGVFSNFFFPWWPFLFIKKTAFDLDHMGYVDVIHTI